MVVEQSTLNQMRETRFNFSPTLMEFIMKVNDDKDLMSVFYEGEDGKYYDYQIEKYLTDDFNSFPVGSKNNVIKLWEYFNYNREYDNIKKLYFIDNDNEENSDFDDNVYITPCYSVENFYCSENCIKKILKTEFYLNYSSEDSKKCVSVFKKHFNVYNNIIVDFNAIFLLNREKARMNPEVKQIKISDVKIKKLFTITLNEVSKSSDYEKNILKLIEESGLTVEEVELKRKELLSSNIFPNNLRGKNQLSFVVKYIELLKANIKNEEFFSKKISRVQIEATKNTLSILSRYADVSPCLIDFLQSHK